MRQRVSFGDFLRRWENVLRKKLSRPVENLWIKTLLHRPVGPTLCEVLALRARTDLKGYSIERTLKFAVHHKQSGKGKSVILMEGNKNETPVKAQLFSIDTLHVQVPASIDLDQFESDVAMYSYDSEAADIRSGFDVNAADLKRAIAEDGEIASGVLDFLKRVIALPFEPDDYFFYAEKRR